ncbi:MAG: hypothetical protein HW421_540 [Ignavibacteria bacterium]|nr:hypothetical protein [Ignavibacteria bacterium]
MNGSEYREKFNDKEWEEVQFIIIWMLRTIARADGRIDKLEIRALNILTKLAKNFKNELVGELIVSVAPQLFYLTTQFHLTAEQMQPHMEKFNKLMESKFEHDFVIDFKKTLIASVIFVANSSGDVEENLTKINPKESQILQEFIGCLKMTDDELQQHPSIEDITVDFRKVLVSKIN